jgi:hypothetical protein
MRRPARLGVVSVMAVVAGVLGGCGADPEEAYCDTLQTESRELERLAKQSSQPGTDVLRPTLASLQRLSDDAPPHLEDEYATLVYAWEGVVDAVDRAGVDPEAYRPGRMPEGVRGPDARRLEQTTSTLVSPRIRDAANGIEDHAEQVCGLDLTL